MNPSTDVQALLSIRIDISSLEEGTQLTVKWRGKPVFIRYRTGQEVEAARRESPDSLPDCDARNPNLVPGAIAADENRAVPGNERLLVMIGVCTNFGCVPLGNGAGDFGGWICPCHGSHYDTSVRIRKSPAPENLPTPKFSLSEDMVLILG